MNKLFSFSKLDVKFQNKIKCNLYILGMKISFKCRKSYVKPLSESKLAHKYLDGLRGIEIGGASYAPWGLNTLNIDFRDGKNIYTDATKEFYNIKPLDVDIISFGDDLPFKDNVWDFVINSHCIEHFWDPIKTIKEWMRVIKTGGYLFMVVPHKERTHDRSRNRTTLKELIVRHSNPDNAPDPTIDCHYSVWITEDFLELCNYLNLNVVEYADIDDRNGIGFTIVIKK